MNENTRTRLLQAVGIFTVLLISVTIGFGQTDAPKPNQYGARDPIVCKDKKAPAKGAIIATLAAKYVNCERDKVSGQYLYLVQEVKAEVGASQPEDGPECSRDRRTFSALPNPWKSGELSM